MSRVTITIRKHMESAFQTELLLQKAKEPSLQLFSLDVAMALNSFLGFRNLQKNQKGRRHMENEEEGERLRNDVG